MKKYATHHHRKWCKENGVRLTASPKGNPVLKSAYQKAQKKNTLKEMPLKVALRMPSKPIPSIKSKPNSK